MPEPHDRPAGAIAQAVPAVESPLPPLARRLGGLARRAAWRVMHPAERGRFVEASRPVPLARLYYTASDGWRAPLFHLPPAPGTSGEPVVLAHAVGLGADTFRQGAGPTLASRLSRAGFSVYLLSHRGDHHALPSPHRRGFDFDDILERDVPAALARVREHASAERVHWIGHGLGGQLGLAWAARTADDQLASLVTLCAPVRFLPGGHRSEARRLAQAAALLPSHWRLPSRSLAWAAAPWVDGEQELIGQVQPGASPGARVRGALEQAVEDLPAGLIAQMGRWMDSGVWSDRSGLLDHAEALVDARGPLLVVAAEGDALCPASCALHAAERWGGGPRSTLVLPASWGHLDPLLGHESDAAVTAPVLAWLERHRQRAWHAAMP